MYLSNEIPVKKNGCNKRLVLTSFKSNFYFCLYRLFSDIVIISADKLLAPPTAVIVPHAIVPHFCAIFFVLPAVRLIWSPVSVISIPSISDPPETSFLLSIIQADPVSTLADNKQLVSFLVLFLVSD